MVIGNPGDIKKLDSVLVQLTKRLGYDLHCYPLSYLELEKMDRTGAEMGGVEQEYLMACRTQAISELVANFPFLSENDPLRIDPGDIAGFCSPTSKTIYINPSASKDLNSVLGHELGHSLMFRLGIMHKDYLPCEVVADLIGSFLQQISKGEDPLTEGERVVGSMLLVRVGRLLKQITKGGTQNG